MRALNVLLAVLVSFLLAFAVFEGGLRLFPQFRPQEQINQFDSKLGWSKKPNFVAERSTPEFDVTFEINSLGLRDDPMDSTAKEPNTFRVVALGDSFVLGFTVDRENLFVDELERVWVDENRRVDVINAGTEGYSTDQEVAWFLEHGVDFEPDLVLIFPYENDIYWNGQERYTRYPKPRFDAQGNLETGTLADPGPGSALSRWATGKALGAILGGLLGGDPPGAIAVEGVDKKISPEFAPLLLDPPAMLNDCLARTKGALRALRDRCNQLGARLVMVPIPSESVVHADQREAFRTNDHGLRGLPDDAWSPDRPVELFLTMGGELAIETLDPRAYLRSAGEDEPLYFDAEWHFNPAGNAAFASYLHDELDRLGVFPAEHSATKEAGPVVASGESGGIPTWLVVYGVLVLVLGTSFKLTYQDEPLALAYVKVAALLALIFGLVLGLGELVAAFPEIGQWIAIVFVVGVLGFVAYKLGRRIGTVVELLRSFTLRGHWYLMPLVVVLLTIGSLLVVAASSPLVAPFIYTLF